MHKYSYELSASYRHEAKQPHQYYLPQKIQPSSFHHTNNTLHYPPGPSQTFIRSQNNTIITRIQPPATRPPPHSILGRSYSGLKMKEPSTQPPPWQQCKPPAQSDDVQNRLKILSHLGERHEQAIRDIDCCKPDSNQSPIRGIYQESALKREFSFNRIPEAAISYQLREDAAVERDSRMREYPLRSKDSMLNAGSFKMDHMRQKPQLRINMERGESKGSTWRNQNGFDLRADKPTGPNETVAKLSSLQERIRTTVQPYAQR